MYVICNLSNSRYLFHVTFKVPGIWSKQSLCHSFALSDHDLLQISPNFPAPAPQTLPRPQTWYLPSLPPRPLFPGSLPRIVRGSLNYFYWGWFYKIKSAKIGLVQRSQYNPWSLPRSTKINFQISFQNRLCHSVVKHFCHQLDIRLVKLSPWEDVTLDTGPGAMDQSEPSIQVTWSVWTNHRLGKCVRMCHPTLKV